MKLHKKVSFIVCYGILVLIAFIPNGQATHLGDTHSVNFTQYFQITEYSDDSGNQTNIDSINLN